MSKCKKCGEGLLEGDIFGELCVGCFLTKIAKPKSVLFILIFITVAVILFEILSFLVGHNNLVVIAFIILLLIFLRRLFKIIKSRK